MYFETPGAENRQGTSGYPLQSGYVQPADGLSKLAFGSVIAGYSRAFLQKMDYGHEHTLDVYYGLMAALDRGYYVVKDEQHVHLMHSSADNMGFTGKLRAATGDEALRVAELNHFQLLSLYDYCLVQAGHYHPDGIPRVVYDTCINIILGQSRAWLDARKKLHANNLIPMILP
jgi:hypothetical protein